MITISNFSAIAAARFLAKVAKIVLKGENKNIRLRRKTLFLAAARNKNLLRRTLFLAAARNKNLLRRTLFLAAARNKNPLRRTLFLAAARNKKTKDVSVVLVTKREMKSLNKRYRKIDKATDVLSFDYGDSGEVVLCQEEIQKNAKKFDVSFKKEFVRVLIHGILHLCGYEHEKSRKEAKKMEQKEIFYLKFFN